MIINLFLQKVVFLTKVARYYWKIDLMFFYLLEH